MTTTKELGLQLGDRVKGQEHRCNGNSYLCDKNNCRKFGGFVIDMASSSVSIRGFIGESDSSTVTIATRWIREIMPEIQNDSNAKNVIDDFIHQEKRDVYGGV